MDLRVSMVFETINMQCNSSDDLRGEVSREK